MDELADWDSRSVQEWQALWELPRLHILANTGSTNDDVRTLIEQGAPDGTVVIAERQTAGRGQHGRRWHGVFGKSLHLSTAFRPDARDFFALPAAPVRVGVAVALELAALTGLPIRVKWPNDLLIRDRKTGGILCEGVIGPKPFVVIGIGINVAHSPADLPDELRASATSLAIEGAPQFTRADVAGALITALRRISPRIAEPLSRSELQSFAELDVLRDCWVEADGKEGKACGVALSGALMLENSGRVNEIRTGPVRIMRPHVSP